jgi:peptidoglycan/LPS O-acetylase OafA/YrhL
VFLGTISYGIYLWHPIVLRVAEKTDVTFTTLSLLVFVLVVAIPVAYLSLRIVERPAMEAERRYERRHRARHTAVVAPA